MGWQRFVSFTNSTQKPTRLKAKFVRFLFDQLLTCLTEQSHQRQQNVEVAKQLSHQLLSTVVNWIANCTSFGVHGLDEWTLMTFQKVFIHLNVEVSKQIAQQLWQTVINWIDKYSSTRKVSWKQVLKKKFIIISRFEGPGQRRKNWKAELRRAANITIEETCPNWCRGDPEDYATYQLINAHIQKLTQKRTGPRQDWLMGKAFAWLEWLADQPPQNFPWSPVLSLQVAYELFVSSPACKLESFVGFLERKKNAKMNEFLQVRPCIIARSIGLFLLQYVTSVNIYLLQLEHAHGHPWTWAIHASYFANRSKPNTTFSISTCRYNELGHSVRRIEHQRGQWCWLCHLCHLGAR